MKQTAFDWSQFFTLNVPADRQLGAFAPSLEPEVDRIDDPFDRFPLREYWLYYLPRPLTERRRA